jgi:hypothetical protein
MSDSQFITVEEQNKKTKKERKPRSEKQQENDKKLKEKFEAYHKVKKEKSDQLKAIMDAELIKLELEEKLELERKAIDDIKKKPSTYKKKNKKFPATDDDVKIESIIHHSSR